MKTNVIYNEDCLETMGRMEDNSVDFILTDPPYDIESADGGGAFGSKKREYHSEIDKNGLRNGIKIEVLNEILRVMKKINLYIFCNKNLLPMFFSYFEQYNYDLLCYHKLNPTPMCNNKYLSDTEYILYVREAGVKLYGTYETKKKYFLQNNAKNNFEHPTVKPLNIIETLLKNSTKENDLVYDPFIGSGTTAVACERLNRKWIGSEISEKYCKLARERIKRERDQGKLF